MRASSLLLMMPLAVTGCYFSYSEGSDDGWSDDDWDNWGDSDTDVLPDEAEPDTDPNSELADSFSFEPDQLTLGDMQVIELHADPDLCAAVVFIDILADVTINAVDTVGDEIRIAVTVDAGADVGTVHVLVELDDGTTVFLEDALEVLAEGVAPATDECP